MKKISLFIIFGILIFAAGCNRAHLSDDKQNANSTPPRAAPLDSLLHLAAIAPTDTNLALLYYDIAELYKQNDFDKAKEYYLKLSNLSEQLNWNRGRYLFTKAYTLLLAQEMPQDNVIEVEQRKDELTEAEDNVTDISKMQTVSIARSLGEAFIEKALFEQILQYYKKSLYERKNDQETFGLINLLIGAVYNNIHSKEKAIEFYEKAVVLLKDDPRATIQLARTYSATFQFEKAVHYFEKAIEICKQQDDLFFLGTVYSLFTYNCLYTGDFEKGATLAPLALEICRKTDNPFSIPALIFLCKVEQMQNHHEQAELLIQEALQVAQNHEIHEAAKVCMMILSELALAQHKPLPQFQNKEELYLLDDLTAIEATYWVATEMETAYETAKKDLKIEQQKNIIARQTMQRWLLTGSIVACVLILIIFWYMLRLRRRHNLALQEKTEILAEMNATKNKFFSVISHDLKNPAISLRDALQILLINAHSWDVDALNKYYNELLKSAENHVEFIYGLLSWAQIQTGRISFTPVPFFLPKLIPEISMIKKMAENKGITLNISIPEEAVVSCDVNMLLTVVRNLLTNAVKFTPTGGTVQLDVSPAGALRATPLRKAPTHMISITDTGTGMTQQQITELFHLDTLHSHKGTNGEEGSGLGLIICKEFLEKHNSTLHIESEEGQGSRVWFEL